MNIKQVLKTTEIFSGIDDAAIVEIAEKAEQVQVAADSVIFKEGDQPDSFYVVASGEIIIFKKLAEGREKTLAVLGAGSVFGETGLLSKMPRTADASAKSDAVLLKIDSKAFSQIIENNPQHGVQTLSKLLETVMRRLEQTSRELATIYQTGKVISSGKNVEDIVKALKEEIMPAIPEADVLNIFLYNEFNIEYAPVSQDASGKVIDVKDPLIGLLKDNPSGISSRDSFPGIKTIELVNTLKSFIITPLIKSGIVLGFFVLGSTKEKNAFNNSHYLLLSTVGSQLADTVENIKFQQEEKDRRRLEQSRGMM